MLAEQGKIDEIIASLEHITSDAEKARTLARLAENNVKNKAGKIQLLERALQYLSDGLDTSDPFAAYCNIVSVYAQVDAERGFALFEPQLDSINRFWEAAALYCSFESNGICPGRKGELVVLPQSGLVRSLYEFLNTFRALGKADFFKASELAQRIKNPEVRCHALISLIESKLVLVEDK